MAYKVFCSETFIKMKVFKVVCQWATQNKLDSTGKQAGRFFCRFKLTSF